MGTRPRVAVELRPEGVVAARADGSVGVLAAVSRGELREGAVLPGLRAGNVADRAAVSGAVRRALDEVAAQSGERSRYVTLVVPDAAVRVLLLDFDALPGKAAEAMAVVRFRLKKLLPFDAEHAVVSYQVMSSERDMVRVLVAAMPCEVLTEYERVVTEAGYLPGSVLPSTLAALAGIDAVDDSAAPALVVNAGPETVTTAIVRGGVLLLHRTVDLRMDGSAGAGAAVPSGRDPGAGLNGSALGSRLAGTDGESFAGEWSRQDLVDAGRTDAGTEMLTDDMPGGVEALLRREVDEVVEALNEASPVSVGHDVTQAVSVAAAYFEDTLGGPPAVLLAAGTMGAERMRSVLRRHGMEGLEVREMVEAEAMGAGASTTRVARGWLAGVRGALRS